MRAQFWGNMGLAETGKISFFSGIFMRNLKDM
jgi:hypothetical protein